MAKHREKTVLFLCTGNYYRSRFAEVLFNSVAGRTGLSWRASSRGLALERGVNNVGPMAVKAVKALEALAVPQMAFGRVCLTGDAGHNATHPGGGHPAPTVCAGGGGGVGDRRPGRYTKGAPGHLNGRGLSIWGHGRCPPGAPESREVA